jgi:hypothetical protein
MYKRRIDPFLSHKAVWGESLPLGSSNILLLEEDISGHNIQLDREAATACKVP